MPVLGKLPQTINNQIAQTGKQLTLRQLAFIDSYVLYKNARLAAKEAGYKHENDDTMTDAEREDYWGMIGQSLLDNPTIASEIIYRLEQVADSKTASAQEVLQFYTSVMRGEILDQFGIEASLDTRIKAANELAKHLIELPMKLKQRQENVLGSVTLNIGTREEISDKKEEIQEEIEEITQ